uniref:Uncharacterized protein n=1 Tax=Lutzomyia longipalpis TaxID=7200 RepID=A0A1B0CHU8_LUTLO
MDFIDDFLTMGWCDHFRVLFSGMPHGRKTSRKMEFIIILLDKYRESWVKKIVHSIKESFLWDVTRTNVLVVSFTTSYEDNTRVLEIFSEENMPKMALLLPNSSFLLHNKFSLNNPIIILPAKARLEEVFQDKLKNLNGYEFRLSQYGVFPRSMVIGDHVFGFDGHLLDTLVASINSTYRIMAPGFSPDIFFRTVNDVLTDKADFNFNLRILFERSHQEAKVSWLYPLRVRKIKGMLILETIPIYIVFSPFTASMVAVWAVLVASIQRDPLGLAFNVIRITALSPLPRFMGTRTESILVVSALFLSFFFINRLQSIVTAFLVWPGFNKNIDTVAELNASKWSVLIPEGVMDLINTVDHGYDEYFLNKFIESELRPEHARHMEPEDLNGFAVYGFNVDPRVLYVANADGTQPLLHLMEECIFHSIASYIFQKHSPYVAPFNRVLRHINEAGLTTYWRDIAPREIVHLNRSMDRLDGNIEYHSRKLHLRFKDLYFTFFLYYVGTAAAAATFLGEILIHNRCTIQMHLKRILCTICRRAGEN